MLAPIVEAGQFVEWKLWGGLLRVEPGGGMQITPYGGVWKGKKALLSKGIKMPPGVLQVLSQEAPDYEARKAAVEEVRVLCSSTWPPMNREELEDED